MFDWIGHDSCSHKNSNDSGGGGGKILGGLLATIILTAGLASPAVAADSAADTVTLYTVTTDTGAPVLSKPIDINDSIIEHATIGNQEVFLTGKGNIIDSNGRRFQTPSSAGKIKSITDSMFLGSDNAIYQQYTDTANVTTYPAPAETTKIAARYERSAIVSSNKVSLEVIALTKQGDVYGLESNKQTKIYDHSQYGAATDILTAGASPLILAGGKLLIYTNEYWDSSTGNPQPKLLDKSPSEMSNVFSFKYSGRTASKGNPSPVAALAADKKGRIWQIKGKTVSDSDGRWKNDIDVTNVGAGGYAKPDMESAGSEVYIDNDNRLIDRTTNTAVVGRRFSAVYQSSTGGILVAETGSNHSELAKAGALPQSGDPAASWTQVVPYLVAAVAIVGAAAAVGVTKRRTV